VESGEFLFDCVLQVRSNYLTLSVELLRYCRKGAIAQPCAIGGYGGVRETELGERSIL
jgi:hypothetical protein